jgi:hypothetical protein
MTEKSKAFGTVQAEIAGKIREHTKAKGKATGKKRKELDLAIRNLKYLRAELSAAYMMRIYCPRAK